MSDKKTERIQPIEPFPFKSLYDDLIMGETLSRRGNWWTAVLLVKSKAPTSISEDDSDPTKEFTPKMKIIIQRWQKIKRKAEDSSGMPPEFWARKKDFSLSKKAQWQELKRILDSWINEGKWED